MTVAPRRAGAAEPVGDAVRSAPEDALDAATDELPIDHLVGPAVPELRLRVVVDLDAARVSVDGGGAPWTPA